MRLIVTTYKYELDKKMITINNLIDIHGINTALSLPSEKATSFDAKGLTLMPALIDPHVHFRTPGMEYKEDWCTGAKAALRGGYTQVFDMPNTLPPTITKQYLDEKKALIDSQLNSIDIPLRYQLFFGADKNHFDELPTIQHDVIGIKVFMGCSTGNLVIDDDESLEKIFKIAATLNLLVAVHAEDEHLLNKRKAFFAAAQDYADHSHIRNEEVASIAVQKAINLTRRYGTKLYILHTSTRDELTLIRNAKNEKLPVYAETTPHHLFLNTDAYATLLGKAVVNPPLRDQSHHDALWEAVLDGTIDTIGSDHAPHLESEKREQYGVCPSGMPGIETTLPLLLNAYHEKKISLQRIIELTSKRARVIFNLPAYDDYVFVDLNKEQRVSNESLQTKCHWSPFEGQLLRGLPCYVVLKNTLYDLTTLKPVIL